MLLRRVVFPTVFAGLVSTIGLPAQAAAPSVKDALGLKPIQKDVAFDEPEAKEVENCTIASEKIDEGSAWVVRGAAGQLLRCFADTNADNRVDQWRYYTSGIESYRDVDSDFNGKADQYRWLGLSGTRWGVDKDEDGQVDSWKSISAEEVTYEIVAAVQTRDAARFSRLLLSPQEMKALGLSGERAERISKSVEDAPQRFNSAIRTQKAITAQTKWLHFGASLPGTLPAGTDGSQSDIMVYENVVAMLDNAGTPGQLTVGTLVPLGIPGKRSTCPSACRTKRKPWRRPATFSSPLSQRQLPQPYQKTRLTRCFRS